MLALKRDNKRWGSNDYGNYDDGDDVDGAVDDVDGR